MRPLSPTEAIAPSIARTRQMLFSPFRIGTSWKVGMTGYLSALGTAFIPWPLMYLAFFAFTSHSTSRALLIGLCAASLVGLAIFLVLFYLVSKLSFAFFGMVLHREPMVRPMWRLYGPAALPWTLFRIFIGSILLALFALPFVHALRQAAPLFEAMQPRPGQPPDPHVFANVMVFYALFFGLYLMFALYLWIMSLLSDFILPLLALESVSLSEAFRRTAALLRAEPGQVTGYALMKLILSFVGFIAATVAIYIGVFLFLIAAFLIFGILGFALHLAHVPTSVLLILGMVIVGMLYLVFVFYITGLCMGSLNIFLEAYMQHFLAGRYPLLGNLLEQSTPAPPQPIYTYQPPPDWPPPAA